MNLPYVGDCQAPENFVPLQTEIRSNNPEDYTLLYI